MRSLITNYTFNKVTKQITFTDYGSISLERVLLVVDVTNGITIYQPNNASLLGTASSNVLTLAYNTNTGAFNNTDKLEIFYEVDTQAVSAASLPLPTGASTSALQSTGNASLASIDTKLTSPLTVTGPLTDAQLRATPVPVAGSFSISGGATEAKQDVGNASLASIDSKTPALVLGRQPVDGSGVTQPISAAALPLPSGASTAANQTTGNTSLASIDSKLSGSLAVTGPLTDAQLRATPVPVSGSFSISGGATEAKQDVGNALLDSIDTNTVDLPNVIAAEGGTQPSKGVVVMGHNGAGVARHIRVDSTGVVSVSGPLTDAQLRASAVPVSAASLPLPTGAATETTLTAVNNKLLTPVSTLPQQSDNYYPVRPLPLKKFRTTFAATRSSVDPTFFNTIVTGSGQAVSQSGGNLVITTGTTTNAETILRSVETFSDALIAKAKTILSQRIANQNFFVELVDVIGDDLAVTVNSATSITVTIPSNPFTSENVGQSMYIGKVVGVSGAVPGRYAIASVSGNNVTFTVAGWPASGSGTLSLFGWNYYQLLYTGTTATNVSFDCQRRGWNSGFSTATIQSTASPGHLGIVQSEDGVVTFMDQLVATSTGVQTTTRASRVENIPAQETNLYLQLRVLNGSTAPASTTTWTVGLVSIENYVSQSVAIHNVKAQSLNTPLPVAISGSQSINIGQIAASTVTSGVLEQASTTNRVLGTVLAAPSRNNATEVASAAITATGNGTTITAVGGSAFSAVVNATIVSGTNPTLDTVLQESFDDGTTWVDVWHCERQTAVSTVLVPMRPSYGRRRWNHVISGTTPSFTRSITTMLASNAALPIYQFFDRTANVLNGTLNATTSGYWIVGAKIINARITLGAATTPATYQIQVSDDNTNWSSVGTATPSVANQTTTLSVNNIVARFARVIVTSAATAQTGTVVSITGSN